VITRKKQTIPYDQVLEKVQSVLASYPKECRNMHVDALQVHAGQVDGANWHVVRFRRSGEDNDLGECRSKLASELRLLRQTYDVETDI
jgi:hypothetical protein